MQSRKATKSQRKFNFTVAYVSLLVAFISLIMYSISYVMHMINSFGDIDSYDALYRSSLTPVPETLSAYIFWITLFLSAICFIIAVLTKNDKR